jgi:hypothetical protein
VRDDVGQVVEHLHYENAQHSGYIRNLKVAASVTGILIKARGVE